jgi:hypothetical protein
MHGKITDTPRKAFHSDHWICCLCPQDFLPRSRVFAVLAIPPSVSERLALRALSLNRLLDPYRTSYDRSVKHADARLSRHRPNGQLPRKPEPKMTQVIGGETLLASLFAS